MPRLTCDAGDHAMTPPLPLEDTYIVSLELRDTFHQMWVDGRQVPLGLITQGTALLVNLNHRIEGIPARSFDTLHWYIPRQALDVITDDQSVPSVKELRSPSGGKLDDATIRSVGMSLLPAFERPEQANRLFVDSVTTGLLAHLAHSYGEMSIKRRLRRGGFGALAGRGGQKGFYSPLQWPNSPPQPVRGNRVFSNHFFPAL